MSKKKLLAAIISLTLVIAMVLPGTLAVSTAQSASESSLSVDTPAPDTVNMPVDVKTGDAAVEEAKAAADQTPSTSQDGASSNKTGEEGETEQKECTCGLTDGTHLNTCPLYQNTTETKPGETGTTEPGSTEGETGSTETGESGGEAKDPETPETPAEPEKTCDCGSTDGTHAETCPLYEKPAEPEKTCTCGRTDGTHAEDCPLYTPPALTCTCGSTDGTHAETCPLYVAPAFDAAKAKSDMLALGSVEEVESYLSALTEEQQQAVLALFTRAEIEEFAKKLGVDTEIKVITPPVNYTEVGPLKDAVQTAPKRRALRANNNEEKKGLILNKTAAYNEKTNTVTITMEAYTTGTVTTSAHSTPVDIVMVLDESGSMTDNMQSFRKVYDLDNEKTYYVKNGSSYIQVKHCYKKYPIVGIVCNGWYSGGHFIIHWGTQYYPMESASDTNSEHTQFYEDVGSNQSKRAALISAAGAFADKVYQNAVDNNVDHRMSVIGFSTSSNIKVGLEDDIRNNLETVKTAISGLSANGGTYIENGMSDAKNVFDNAAVTTTSQRKRVVIVFTDGIPGSGTWDSTTISGSANPTIKTSNELKNTYGATVYTIGMLTDANPELEISDETDDTALTNKFLHYVSSNYPNASSMSKGGTGSNAGYYLSASDMESLNAIFTKISEEISTPSIQLDGETQIRDIITPQFVAPKNTNAIHLYTVEYNGSSFADTLNTAQGVTANIAEDGTVTVQGFNFNENFISENVKPDGTHGRKLVVAFDVEVRDGFLGGNDVYTNGDKSGVYNKEGKEVEFFPQPTVNVPIPDITVTAEDKNVYLFGGLTKEELLANATVKAGKIDLKLGETNYGLSDWQHEYVEITDELVDEKGNAVTNLNDLTDDGTYTLKVSISPNTKTPSSTSNGTPATAQEKSEDIEVNVFKPIITFEDLTAYYGDIAPDALKYSTEWKHETGKLDTEVMMTGGRPNVTASNYLTETGKIVNNIVNTKTDFPAKASVIKVGSTTITDANKAHVTIAHKDCANQTCTLTGDWHFWIHVKTCQLTIKKQGGDSNEPYVFNVYKDNDSTVYTQITVMGNSNGTIYELPVGTYSITEDEGWSWRYKGTVGNAASLSAQNPIGEITCKNEKQIDKWLNGFSAVVRNIFGKTN